MRRRMRVGKTGGSEAAHAAGQGQARKGLEAAAKGHCSSILDTHNLCHLSHCQFHPGLQVSDQGELIGLRQVQRVAVRHTTHCWTKHRVEKCEEASHYTVQLPAAGAAMLVVPRLDYM